MFSAELFRSDTYGTIVDCLMGQFGELEWIIHRVERLFILRMVSVAHRSTLPTYSALYDKKVRLKRYSN
jgi:hypothetical protein